MSTSLPSRKLFDQDWKRVSFWGSICALSQVFICLVGLPAELNRRILIESTLSLGYLFIIWVPLVFGYVVSKMVELEGVENPKPGAAELLSGAITGLLGGLGLVVLMLGIDNFDLRDPLLNWNPKLLRLLTFENSIGFGSMIWLLVGVGLGVFGASLHQMTTRIRKMVAYAIFGLFTLAVLEDVIDDLSEGLRLEWLSDMIYAKRGGITVTSTIVIAVVLAALPLLTRGKVKEAVSRYRSSDNPAEQQRNSIVLFALVAVVFLVLPWFLGGIINELLANVGLFLLLALGLNIVVGLAGLLDLGYVAFFAVGGYTTAVFTSPNSPWFSPETHFGISLLVVVVMATLAGLLIGAPVIRMRGDYLAIVTLGFGEIIRLLFLSDWLKPYLGGSQGITNIPGIDLGPWEVRGADPRSVFYMVLAFCVLAIYVSWRLQGSRIGRAWMAIREDESVAEVMGINTVNSKLMAFVVGAVLASFSGAVLAAKVGSVFPKSFEILVSIIILVVVIVGGMGSITGVMVGSLVLIGILGGPRQPGLLQEFQNYKLLIYGALLVFMMLKRPEGLVPTARRTRELHQEEYLQDAWLGDDDSEQQEEAGERL
ncbi:MAG: branched-chain amino acid ABC transporter permease [Actinomycetota bacterium]|nr:branched-chain amino acid ABC transporter permease [Actinomycetota bacterium]MED5276765.1 branched-chain amino acid ABC transporter permease [Actinomycetota bacterium]